MARMSTNGLPQARNGRATASVVVGLAAVLSVPLAIAASRFFHDVTLLRACGSAIIAAVLGVSAVVLARRGRETAQRTLGRSGGVGAARTGRSTKRPPCHATSAVSTALMPSRKTLL